MKNNVQFYGENDDQINPKEMPLLLHSLFPNYSAPCPTSVKNPGNPEPKTLSTLEAFVREMERAVEHAEGMHKGD